MFDIALIAAKQQQQDDGKEQTNFEEHRLSCFRALSLHCQIMNETSRVALTMAALRILRLLEHFSHIKCTPRNVDVLVKIIQTTPLRTWLTLAPQLFARLDRCGEVKKITSSTQSNLPLAAAHHQAPPKSIERFVVAGLLQRLCASLPTIMVWSVVPTRGRNDEYFQALHALAPQMVEGVFSLCRHLRAMAESTQ